MNCIRGTIIAFVVGVSFQVFGQPVVVTPPMKLSEFLFWDTMSKSAGTAVRSYQDYAAERQSWKNNAEAARREMARCGDCPQAKAELEKWQGIENQFQDIAGTIAKSAGMPPILATALGIKMPMVVNRPGGERPECNILRPAWVNKIRPDCQVAVDKHLSCLRSYRAANNNTCYWDAAERPLGGCWDSLKLYEHCAKEDYASFESQQAVHTMRAAGKIIPAYVPYGLEHYILYGPTPNDFVPQIPADVVIGELNEPNRTKLTINMSKQRAGTLYSMVIKNFDNLEIDPKDICLKDNNSELQRRQCLDYRTAREHEKKTSKMLACNYTGQTLMFQNDYLYWYNERPESANLEYLLRRASNHWFLRVGEARTTCPATLQEAVAIQNKYRSEVATVAARIPQVPEGTILPPPTWLEDKTAARIKEHNEAKQRAYDRFKWEGRYELFLEYVNRSQHKAICTIEADGDKRYAIKCIQEVRKRILTWDTVYGKQVGHDLLVVWQKGAEETPYRISWPSDGTGLGYSRPKEDTKSNVEVSFFRRLGDLPSPVKPEDLAAIRKPVFDGTWTGQVQQGGLFPTSYSMEMTLQSTTGTIHYRSLRCVSSLKLVSSDEVAKVYQEKLYRGKCSRDGTVTVTLAENLLHWTWTGNCGTDQCSATAKLTRK